MSMPEELTTTENHAPTPLFDTLGNRKRFAYEARDDVGSWQPPNHFHYGGSDDATFGIVYIRGWDDGERLAAHDNRFGNEALRDEELRSWAARMGAWTFAKYDKEVHQRSAYGRYIEGFCDGYKLCYGVEDSGGFTIEEVTYSPSKRNVALFGSGLAIAAGLVGWVLGRRR